MARSGRSRNRNNSRRDVVNIANPRLPSTNFYAPRLNSIRSPSLRLFEDRRTFHPEGPVRPARSFNLWRHTLTVAKNKNVRPLARARLRPSYVASAFASLSHGIGFEKPRSVLICVRRNIRKQVMFALRKAGRRGQRRPRFNWYSSVRCR